MKDPQKLDILSSRLQKWVVGLGSRMLSSLHGSSSRSIIDFWRKTMLLMVLTGELAWEWNEPLSELALEEVDEADEDLRNEVRRLCREKRAVMDWKREVCMLTGSWFGIGLVEVMRRIDCVNGCCVSECVAEEPVVW